VKAVRRVCFAVVILVCASGWAQTESSVAEQGVFNLHKFEQII
jgi:hypothetical protein